MTGQQTSGASLLHFTTTILVLADSLNHSDQFTRRDSLVENEPSTTPTSAAYRAVAFGYFEVMSQQVETPRRPVATSIRYLITLNWSSPNVSQGGGERAKSSSIRRRSALNLRKSSYGPSPAGLLAVLAPSVSIFCQGKTHHSPNSACCPNSSRYSLPFSQQRRAVTCNCRYTWRNSSR